MTQGDPEGFDASIVDVVMSKRRCVDICSQE